MLSNGYILDNRYQIISKIGQGGMAVVYRARDLKLERNVAIKLLKKEFSQDTEFIERFKNEARSAAKLSHSNIVAAYDIVNSGELHYIVMELVEGITLRDYIARKGRLSNKETIGIALQTAEGLSEAHKNGIIHRDIKSQNIIISKEGRIKIGDFGIAGAASMDNNGQPVIGSAHYIAPEQAAAGEADARSDLYSLGISMYEMITGRLPYQGEDAQEVIEAQLQDALVPPNVYNSGIYPALNDIIIKATKKAPEDRYQSADELIDDLKHAAAEPAGHFVKLYDSVASGSSAFSEANHIEAVSDKSGAAQDSENASLNDTFVNAGEETASRQAHDAADGGNNASGRDDFTESDDEDDGEDYTVRRHAHRGSKGGILESYEDNKTRLAIAGITAGVVVLAVIIGIFVLKSGHNAYDAAESKLQAESSESRESGSESAAEGESGENYTLSIQGEDIMPDLIGMTVDEARAKLATIRMSMDSSTTDYSDTYAKGTIMNQSPAANEVLTSDSTVYVTVSLGKQTDYVLDNLKNKSKDEAVKAVEEAGMAVSDTVEREFADDVAEDMVAGYKDDGTSEDGKRKIILVLSYGKEEDYVKMPDITAMSIIDAEQLLKENKLSFGNITAINSSDSVETDIVTQSVKADDYVKKGSTIDVSVCVGDDYTIEDGTSFDDAEDAMNAIGGESSVGTVVSPAGTSGGTSSDYYYGNIDTSCVVGQAAGPGASNNLLIAIRLAQRVDGSVEYTMISEPIPVAAGTKIPVSYRNIKGAYGVSEGTVEVYDVNSGNIYSSYVIKFSRR